MKFTALFFLLLTQASFAESVSAFVQRGFLSNPQLKEIKFKEEMSFHESQKANKEALLPRLRMTLAFGPAPGIKEGIDTVMIDGALTTEKSEEYDFSNLGTYFGGELDIIQPLNFGRLTIANRSLNALHQVKVNEIRNSENKISKDLQELYYGYQLAQSSSELVQGVHKQLLKALEETEEKVEDGELSQFELLEMQATLFEVEEGLLEAEEGRQRALSNLQFLFPEQDPKNIFGADSFIVKRTEKIPSLDDFQKITPQKHPDALRLKFGLEALKGNLDLKSAELGPEFFLFGKLEYTKSWVRAREDQEKSVFSQDPLNKIEGALGIGARFDLNFWIKNHRKTQARLEYKQLKLKDNYAVAGLQLKIKEAWLQVERNRKRLESVKLALEATEAWVQGKAVQFDLDPSVAKDLLKAYSKNATMKKNYYFITYDYNLAVAKLIQTSGMTLQEFNEWSSSL